MTAFSATTYFASAHDAQDLPPPVGLEVAFAGRSNAGKSSAINVITGKSRLAFASKTPGRTQMINFFVVAADRYIVDLPGYGYAEVPQAERVRWARLIETYLATRASLRGLVVMMDVRHPLKPQDRQLLEWFAPTEKPILILLTKSDKLSKQQAANQLRAVESELKLYRLNATARLFSSLTRMGVEPARDVIAGWLDMDSAKENPRFKGD